VEGAADMTQQDPHTAQNPSADSDPFVILVLQCQQAYTAWKTAHDREQQQIHSDQYRHLLEQLWLELAQDLRQVAHGWIRSNMAPDVESLAMNMFVNIVFQLPKLRIDPDKNVRNLLITVARRGQIDEYRRSYAVSGRRQSKMLPLDSQSEMVDPASSDAVERTVNQIDRQAVLDRVWDYWLQKLSKDDMQIMRLRWHSDPPSSFGEIAERMGPGWGEDTVRQRHYRIMTATREYLRKHGLIDDNSVL
jgi:DNA-directed RNA polymerase specialized sigma24 family protein